MVDDDRSAVGQSYLFAPIAPGDDVDGRRLVMDDVDVWRRAGDEAPVEPLEVLAHQAPRQEVVGLDRLARGIDLAAIPNPAVAPCDRPVVETDPVARLVVLGLERIQRELAAGVVEQQVVGLGHVVDARAGRSGLDHVHFDVNAAAKPWRAVVTTRSSAQTPHGPSPTIAMRSKAA